MCVFFFVFFFFFKNGGSVGARLKAGVLPRHLPRSSNCYGAVSMVSAVLAISTDWKAASEVETEKAVLAAERGVLTIGN